MINLGFPHNFNMNVIVNSDGKVATPGQPSERSTRMISAQHFLQSSKHWHSFDRIPLGTFASPRESGKSISYEGRGNAPML